MKIGIIVLSYKNVNDTIDCINSLKSLNNKHAKTIKIILVDNSPNKSFLDTIKSHINGFESIYLEENNGYSAGNNVGIRMAIAQGCDYILILNNDTIVEPDFLDELLECYNEDVGIVAPVILRFDDKKNWSTGGKYRKLLCNYIMLRDNLSYNREAEFINGCCFLASRQIFEEVGFLSEKYFMYGEDADFCYQLTKHGYKNVVAYKSIIYHKVSASTGIGSLFQTYYIYRNRLLFIQSNFKGYKRLVSLVSNFIQCLAVATRFLFIGKIRHFKIMLLAIKDYDKEGKSNHSLV